MATQVQIRRGTSAQVAAFTPAAGEVVADMTNKRLYLGDGTTVGGVQQASINDVNSAISAIGPTSPTVALMTRILHR
jgi:hypothetical protein